jgi:hypothetical protein
MAEWALLIFAGVTGAAATWGWLIRRPGTGGVLTAATFLVPVSMGYVWLIATVGGFLAPALPAAVLPAAAIWLITGAVLTVLAGLAALRWAPGNHRLQHTLYVRALSAGHIAPPSTRPATQLTGARS